jgi:stage V sporulation protein S
METLKVSTRSNPNSVAGAMAGAVRQAGAVEVQVVGAGALNQAIKAVAIARGYVAASGIDLVCIPTFADIEIDGERRTAIRLAIEDRGRRTDLGTVIPDVIPEVSAEELLAPEAPTEPPLAVAPNGNGTASTAEATA